MKKIRIDAKDITLNIDGRLYFWYGWLGCIFKSYEHESSVKTGDARYFGNILLKASVTRKIWSKNEVSWYLPDASMDKIKEIKDSVFN